MPPPSPSPSPKVTTVLKSITTNQLCCSWTSYKWQLMVWILDVCFLLLWDSLMLLRTVYSFMLPCPIPLYKYMDLSIWVVSNISLLWMKLLWTFLSMNFGGHRHSLPLLEDLEMEFPGHRRGIDFLKQLYQFTLLWVTYGSSTWPTSLSTLGIISFIHFCHPTGWVVVSHCGFNLPFSSGTIYPLGMI